MMLNRNLKLLPRRGLLKGVCTTFLAQGPLVASLRAVRPACEFLDSVGVCAHLASEPYKSRFETFRELLKASGIRHVRDELLPGTDVARWRDLQTTLNVRWNLLVSPATNTVDHMLDYIKTLGPRHFSAVEGQNEGDSDWFMAQNAARGHWNEAVVAYQSDIYRALRRLYSVSELPVISPTLLDWKPNDVALIRPAAIFSDIVGLHPYVQHAQEPETNEPYAALSWYVQNYRDNFKVGAPFIVTEVGYMNVVSSSKTGLSERAAAIYLPRILLHNFRCGAQRTFLYEFMNGGTDARDNEQNYGLVRSDGTPKPAFEAVRALMAGLKDDSFANVPVNGDRSVRLTVDNPPPDLSQQIFTLRDGRVIVALWRTCRSWDAERGQDIANQPMEVTIRIDQNFVSAEYLRTDNKRRWEKIKLRNRSLDLPIDDRVTLLRLSDHDT